jgi:hypothetical protein
MYEMKEPNKWEDSHALIAIMIIAIGIKGYDLGNFQINSLCNEKLVFFIKSNTER